MALCWHGIPERRPPFSATITRLQDCLRVTPSLHFTPEQDVHAPPPTFMRQCLYCTQKTIVMTGSQESYFSLQFYMKSACCRARFTLCSKYTYCVPVSSAIPCIPCTRCGWPSEPKWQTSPAAAHLQPGREVAPLRRTRKWNAPIANVKIRA